jgi:anthranilate/para-aminobenzoate synthase component I
MIVDLERNDLGRVCVPGTVSVDPLATVFPTPYCHQMVSRVSGSLEPGVSVEDVFDACFPCGSVTGAPKVSAMRHIARTEVSARGAYCGALVVAMPGSIDSSVLIRTLESHGEEAVWGVGCGITYDSDAEAEWEESVLKAWPVLGSWRAEEDAEG